MQGLLRTISIQKTKLNWQTAQLKLYKSVNSYGHKSVLPPLRFYTSKQCPPPIKPKKQRNPALYALGALTLVGGATLGYAKYDPEFRKTLVEYAPITDNIIKIVFQEEDTLRHVSDYFKGLANSVLGFLGSETKEKKPKTDEEIKQYKAPKVIHTEAPLRDSYSEIRLQKDKNDPNLQIAGSTKESIVSEACNENIKYLQEDMSAAAIEAMNSYAGAVKVVRAYNKDIENIIDEAVTNIKPEAWESVRSKTRSKNECLRRAKVKADAANQNLNRLRSIVTRPSFEAHEDVRDAILTNLLKVEEDVAKAKRELDNELLLGSVTEKYWNKVEQARKHFTEELEILFPTIDLSKKKLNIDADELDLFVLHTYANILFYQKELARMETVVQEKVRAAVEAARRGGFEPLTNAQVCDILEKEKRKLALCFQQECLKLRRESENDLREQLKIQSQAFSDHLNDAIKARETEIERCLARRFDEQLETERLRFKKQLAAIVGRLQGIDAALKAKLQSDEGSKRSQVLWSACQALLRSVRSGCPGLSWKEQIRPLDPEIVAVQNAAGPQDELVAVVLETIPPEARERGVYPEDALRERFLKVEKVARNVALVPETGGALPLHILSYLQSLLLVNSASPIPQAELNDELVDFSKLSTNDILQRARYWLDRGDFVQTLKYMNLLQGAPRCVARQWMNETRILLETQLAANTLMAHASSSGLIYL